MTGMTAVKNLRHGDVRVIGSPDRLNTVELTRETGQAVCANGMLPRFWEFVEAMPPGEYTLPIVALEPDAVEDTRNLVAMVEHEITSGCVMPGCLQDVDDTSRGFSMCATHNAHLLDWDDLLVAS